MKNQCEDRNGQRTKDDRKHRIGTVLLAMIVSACMIGSSTRPLTAWWGTMYPRFCYSQIPESGEGTKTKPKVKISFWLAHVLDW